MAAGEGVEGEKADGPVEYKSLRELFAAPKGNLAHENEPTLLHVFWEAPSAEAAATLLAGLKVCAHATLRDTPCVPTYLFRICSLDSDLASPAVRKVGDHGELNGARRKLRMGVPRPVVLQALQKAKVDVALLDADLDADLPVEMQSSPVYLEFTEIYLDFQALAEHAGSREYHDGYAVVMRPGLSHSTPRTFWMGSPSAKMRESIIDSVLKAVPLEPSPTSFLFRKPAAAGSAPFLLSLDLPADGAAVDADVLAADAGVVTFVSFLHPLREGVARVMAVLAGACPTLHSLGKLALLRGEAHADPDHADAVRAALAAAGLAAVPVNATPHEGYPLHPRAWETHPRT
jgi:hypothetical protein